MNKVYCVVSGHYDDWELHGHFKDIDSAERYCALKNSSDVSSYDYDKYYVMDSESLDSYSDSLKDVKLKYEHSVIIDYKNNGDYHVRCGGDDSYSYYLSEDYRKNSIKSYLNGWICFYINTDTRDRDEVERLALELYFEFIILFKELGNEEEALKAFASAKQYNLNLRDREIKTDA